MTNPSSNELIPSIVSKRVAVVNPKIDKETHILIGSIKIRAGNGGNT